MKEIATAFLVMIWLGCGLIVSVGLDNRAYELNCEHSWWGKPLGFIAAPAIVTAAIVGHITDTKPERSTGCI